MSPTRRMRRTLVALLGAVGLLSGAHAVGAQTNPLAVAARAGPLAVAVRTSALPVTAIAPAAASARVEARRATTRPGGSEPSTPQAAQTRRTTLLEADLSTDTIGFGNRFEMRIRLLVAPGDAVWVPADYGEFEAVGGSGRATWSTDEAPDGTTEVALSYPIVPFLTGIVTVPQIVLYAGPAARTLPGAADRGATDTDEPDADDTDGGGSEGSAAGPGGLIRPFATTEELTTLRRDMNPIVVPGRNVWVTAVLRLDELDGTLEPRPADDVIGRSWNAPAIASALVFATLLLGLGFVSGREWLTARGRGAGSARSALDARAAARAHALERLEALIAGGCPDEPAAIERFYGDSSDVVRRYVEHIERHWGPAYTSTELMDELASGTSDDALPRLRAQMRVAEVVKFGRLRPDSDAAIAHCRTLHDWVSRS